MLLPYWPLKAHHLLMNSVAYQFFILYEFAGRRSLQGSGMNIESDKHVQVTLPDNQVSC